MISKNHRFHGLNSVSRVQRAGKTVRSGSIALRYAFGPDHKPWRASVVVSKKVAKSAIVRNRIRRRVYEAVRTRGEAIPAGADLVFNVYSDTIATMPAEDLSALVNKIMLLCK